MRLHAFITDSCGWPGGLLAPEIVTYSIGISKALRDGMEHISLNWRSPHLQLSIRTFLLARVGVT